MLMIRLRGRLMLCLFFLIGISCGFLRLLRSEPLAQISTQKLAPQSVVHPKPRETRPVRLPKDLKAGAFQGIEPGVVHVYELSLKPGEYVHVVIDQDGVDVKAELFGGEGSFLFDVDSLNKAHGPEDVPLWTPEARPFRIEISTSEKGGEYRARIARRRLATDEDRAWFEGARSYYQGRHGDSFREIEASFREAVGLWRSAGHVVGEADALLKLGQLHFNSGYKQEAIAFFRDALPLYERTRSRQREAVLRNELGRLSLELGFPADAEQYHRSALLAAREAGDAGEEGAALTNLCKLDAKRSEFARALAECEEVLPLWRNQRDVIREVEVLNLLGRLYVDLGQAGRGLDQHSQALTLTQGKPQLVKLKARTWTHIGDAYLALSRPQLAILYYRKALKVQREQDDQKYEALTLNNLALAYYSSKNYRDANAALGRAIILLGQQKNLREQTAAFANLGWILDELDKPRDAMESHSQALKLAREINYPAVEVSALFGMAWSERNRRNLVTAQGFVEQAIAVSEAQLGNVDQKDLRTTFIAGRQNFYNLLVNIRMERHRLQPSAGHDISAFEASEGARAFSLRETLNGRFTPPRLTTRDIQRILDPDTILLEYFLGDPYSYLFVVTSTDFTSYTLASETVLVGLAREVHRLLPQSHKRERRAEAIKKSTALGRLLFAQVASRIGGKRLVVVAPPALQYVSFSALPNPAVRTIPNTGWPEAMIERHEIVTVPSVSIIAPLRGARMSDAAPSKLLAMLSDPVNSSRDERLEGVDPEISMAAPELEVLERLEYSDDEADRIVELFPPGSYFEAHGFDVTRDLIVSGSLSSYQILHFATHGHLDFEDAGGSGLVMSRYDRQGRRIDGLLRARDIEPLDLSADLVVLSACGTALGKEIPGEGLVGLTHAFFSAGVPRVIVSLWNVDDQSTSDLMADFYRNLLKSGISPSAALRQAQLSMMKRPGRSAPTFWAGFVLQGDWKSSF